MNKCKCGGNKPRRYAVCKVCWAKVPAVYKEALFTSSRELDKEAKGTLRRIAKV